MVRRVSRRITADKILDDWFVYFKGAYHENFSKYINGKPIRISVMDVTKLDDQDLAGDPDFAKFVNGIENYWGKYCLVYCDQQTTVIYPVDERLTTLVHLPDVYGKVLTAFADEAYDYLERACVDHVHHIYDFIIAGPQVSFVAKSKAALAAIEKSCVL